MTPTVETVETVTKRRVQSHCLGGGERRQRRQRADIHGGRSDDDDDDADASLATSLEAHANGLRAMRACVEEALRGGVDALLASMTASGTSGTTTLWTRVDDLERRARRAETRVQTLEDALVEKTTEMEALRERLGREMIARGAAEDGCESPRAERMRAELELYKEACQKYRKRAERFEELYRRGVAKDMAANAAAGVKPECGRAAAGTIGGVEELVLAKKTATTKATAAPKIVWETQLFGDDTEKLAPGGVVVGGGGLGFKRAMREVRETTLEDDLWGATQKKRSTIGPQGVSRRVAERMVDEEVENARSGGVAKEEDARRRAAAPPLDRIFLDSKNKGSTANETNDNKVRKNKRLSDNSPTGPNEVFGDSETAARGQVKCVEVVRKKSEREQLNAYACEECRTFYSAMMPEKDRATIKCPHALPPNAQNSRHRAKWAPEPAPKGFWNLAFTPPEKSD